MAAPNGMNPGPGAPYAPGGGIFPNAGHHNDVQHIWRLVEELSQALQTNREKYDELQASINAAQIRPQQPQENGLVNGDNDSAAHVQSQQAAAAAPATTAQPDPQSVNQIAHLNNQLTTATTTIGALQTQLHSTTTLLATYESSLQEITARLRQHAYDQQTHTIALHAHYNGLLEQSRNETVQAQLVHQAWQAGLVRLAQGVREAHKEVVEGEGKGRAREKGLKAENNVLRRLAGWEVEPSDESSGESDGEKNSEGDKLPRSAVGSGMESIRERERLEDMGRGRGMVPGPA